MEYYDIIIIGAGIAGCGLVYNLKRIGYQGNVLVLDKKEIGANAAYGYRNTFEEVIKEYNLPYEKKFKGTYLGNKKEIMVKIKHDFYFINYKAACTHLLKNSEATFKKDECLSTTDRILRTPRKLYRFKYLIDCSGPSFFLKRQLRIKIPFKYYIGKLNVYKNKKPEILNQDYFYYQGDKLGHVEDFYPHKEKVIQGDWQITNTPNFNTLRSPKTNVINDTKSELELLDQSIVAAPVSPTFPIAYKNYAFLGDSFGNATPSVGEGIRPILETSKILAIQIMKNNLKAYEKVWKKKYLNTYIKYMASRENLKYRFEILKILKEDQKLLVKMLKNEKMVMPYNLIKKYPKGLIIKTLFHYHKIKLIYFIDKINYKLKLF